MQVSGVRRQLYQDENCEVAETQLNTVANENSSVPNTFTVPVSKEGSKRYFCIFCKTLTTKFARHITLMHENEKEVQEISRMIKNSKERKSLIEKLLKKGTFEYNTSDVYNLERQLIVARRPQASKNRNGKNYECCSNCHSFYSKLTLRQHFRICKSNSVKGARDIMVSGRRERQEVHTVASFVLRNNVLPVLRDDDVSTVIKRDKLLLIFGNKMLQKYRAQYHHKMIRSKLRSLGRLLLALQKSCAAIKDFCSIYNPSHYDLIIDTINDLAGLDKTTGTYTSPSYAFMIGMLLKKIGNLLISECVKDKNYALKEEVTNFLQLIIEDYATSVNKTVQENQLEAKRHKIVDIPSVKDIQMLKTYLDKNREKYYSLLEQRFSFNSWKLLASFTLITLQLFNRRRAGEIERLMVADVEKCHGLQDGVNDDLYNSLSTVGKEAANQYVRCVIRGKLAKGVPVLFHKDHYKCVQLIIKHRSEAKVSVANPYLFGLPSPNDKHKFLSACVLMREFSKKCGAQNPSSLRGTKLRKHIATQSVLLNLNDTDVSDLANFMGHADKIHKDHYRLPIPAREIINISKLLENAQGVTNDCSNETELDNSTNENENSTNENDRTELDNSTNENHLGNYDDRSESNNSTNNKHLDNYDDRTELDNSTNEKHLGNYNDRTSEQQSVNYGASTSKEQVVRYPTRTRRCVIKLTPLKRNSENEGQHIDELQEPFEHSDSSYEPSESDTCEQSFITPVKKTNKNKIFNKKITWNTPERKTARELFADNLKNKTLPDLSICCKLVKKYFPQRTAAQLKAWVNNQNKKPDDPSTPKKPGRKITWRTPEKAVALKEFKKHIENNTLPSKTECQAVLKKHPELKRRDHVILKAFINNEINRRRRQDK